MLTLFAAPKAFNGHNKIIQVNAIKSWMLLGSGCEIILLGKDEGIAEFASETGIRYIPDIEYNSHGTPYVNSVFSLAQNAAKHDVVCYINADIILMNDFMRAVERVPSGKSLAIGQRWDLDINELIDYADSNWEEKIRSRLVNDGTLHEKTGVDYFIFPKGMYEDIPPFYLGRTSWDNWFVFQARFMKVPVIDITPLTTVIHQNHDYRHIKGKGDKETAFKGQEARENQRLLGQWEYSFNINHAVKVLTKDGIKNNTSFKHLVTRFDTLHVLHPRLKFLKVLIHAKKEVLEYLAKLLR
ncbi:MAG: hypothetical protein JW712_11405 [Dehalococcoidales bacterium]|nr:hypothetical protein [Dehalococcoidales bacterium]